REVVVLLAHIFEFCKDVLCHEPTGSQVISGDVDIVPASHLTFHQVVTSSEVEVFVVSEAVDQLSSVLVESSLVNFGIGFSSSSFISSEEFQSVILDERVHHEGGKLISQPRVETPRGKVSCCSGFRVLHHEVVS